MSTTVIKAEHLSKYYQLGVINNGTLFRDIQTWWALKRGKEDPHSQIGSHRYDSTKEGFWALKDLNFEIKQGDRVGIIGKNGAGKSTLLKVLSRITAPTEGKVKIKGRVSSLLEVGTGFHAELTGRENIYLNGAILGMKKREVDRKIDEIIAFSEIENHIDTPVKRYSSGMYVRLAFAVAAHLDSEILIADEVLAVGDAAFQKKALGKMNELSTGEGRTVLFVSHQMNQIKNLCNKGIVLDHGSILRQDDSIMDSINWYLYGDISENSQNITEWQNDGSIGNENFRPNKISLTHNDSVITADSDLTLTLDFTIEDKASNLSFEFYVYSTDNNNLVFSTSPYYNIENYSPEKGNHVISCKLPKDLFNDKRYRIELQAGLFCQKWILEPNVTSPNLYFFVNSKNSLNPFRRQSVEDCAPVIKWNI
ncbi:MAG: ABC transporter ATP-binding protein [Treponema sp.]|nr:ABC transporter ATP-binding protein [Candidatus Treponema merdequi]